MIGPTRPIFWSRAGFDLHFGAGDRARRRRRTIAVIAGFALNRTAERDFRLRPLCADGRSDTARGLGDILECIAAT
jgi:hypothetical protein